VQPDRVERTPDLPGVENMLRMLRAFRRRYGVTPHAFPREKIERSRALLADGRHRAVAATPCSNRQRRQDYGARRRRRLAALRN
jgi:hypothetical protein